MGNVRIALLRGVNTGGRKVQMAELKAGLADMGLKDVRTLQAAGSLVFEDPEGRADDDLERFLETQSETRLGLKTDYHVRRPAAWRGLIDGNPLPDAAKADPSHLILMVFKTDVPAAAWKALAEANPGPETFGPGPRAGYFFYPDGIGTSVMFEKNLIDRTFKVLGTGRNWNTVLKLAEMAGA